MLIESTRPQSELVVPKDGVDELRKYLGAISHKLFKAGAISSANYEQSAQLITVEPYNNIPYSNGKSHISKFLIQTTARTDFGYSKQPALVHSSPLL